MERIADIYGGLLVLGSLPDSPAALAGLRYGDVVTRVNGMRTSNVSEFFKARSLDRNCMTVELVRDGEDVTLMLALNPHKKLDLDQVRGYFKPRVPDAKEPTPS